VDVDAFYRNAFEDRIFQCPSSQLECCTDVISINIKSFASRVVSQQDCFLHGPMLSEVEIALSQCPNRATDWITI
jgi:hypothetical protein